MFKTQVGIQINVVRYPKEAGREGEYGQEEEYVPQIEILVPSKIELTWFECIYERSKCEEVKKQMENQLGKALLDTSKVNHFDQSAASRVMNGFSTLLNRFIKENSQTAQLDFDHQNENLFIFINCAASSVQEVWDKPIKNDMLEFSGMQNLFEMIHPFDLELNLYDEKEVSNFLESFNMSWTLPYYDSKLMSKTKETVKIVKDPKLLNQFSKTMRPSSVRTVKNFKFDDELNSFLDRTLIRQNVYF